MKKTLLLVLCASMFIATAQAQPFKQTGGEKNLQVLFAPLGGQPVSINGISFRKFNATGTAAWRLNIFIGMTNETEVIEQAGDTVQHPTSQDDQFGTHLLTGLNPQADRRSKTFTFSLRPGYEKHFAGTDRISPYIGGELLFSKTSATEERDEIEMSNYSFPYEAQESFPGSGDFYPNNIPDTLAAPWTIYTLTKKGDGASTTFGINLIAGVDFYIVKNLSLGAELGFGFSTTSYGDISDEYVKSLPPSPDPADFDNTSGNFSTTTVTMTHQITPMNDAKQGKASQLGPNVVGQFKLGWLF